MYVAADKSCPRNTCFLGDYCITAYVEGGGEEQRALTLQPPLEAVVGQGIRNCPLGSFQKAFLLRSIFMI